MSSERRLKVQPHIIPSRMYRKTQVYSSLVLKGAWLSRAGFAPGETVNIKISSNCITITPE